MNETAELNGELYVELAKPDFTAFVCKDFWIQFSEFNDCDFNSAKADKAAVNAEFGGTFIGKDTEGKEIRLVVSDGKFVLGKGVELRDRLDYAY